MTSQCSAPRLLIAIIAAVPGCYQPQFSAACRVACDTDGSCPDGLSCGSDNICHDGTVDCFVADPRSCRELPETCGPAGTSSCCDSPEVSGGMFLRSYDVADDQMFKDMSNPATVSTFRLDAYEITVGRFRQFVLAGMGTQQHRPATGSGAHAKIQNSGWDFSFNAVLPVDTAALRAQLQCDPMYQTWTDEPGDNENLPLNCLSWYEAMAFCIWDGGYLPTEAEWNYAASGGSDQRAYPWSVPASQADIDCRLANYSPQFGPQCEGSLSPVGSRTPVGAGRFSQSDLAGSVDEWALDNFAAYQTDCQDCANVTSGSGRVLRGGNFLQTSIALRVARRGTNVPGQPNPAIGARCARPAL